MVRPDPLLSPVRADVVGDQVHVLAVLAARRVMEYRYALMWPPVDLGVSPLHDVGTAEALAIAERG